MDKRTDEDVLTAQTMNTSLLALDGGQEYVVL